MIGNWLRRKLFYKPGKKLPLKHPPLRLPAQGLREEFNERLESVLLVSLVPAIVFFLGIVFGFLGEKVDIGSIVVNLTASLIAGLIAATICFPMAARKRRELHDYRLGMLAEAYVGQQLERCREFGCSVFHDIVERAGTKTFNIDHVVIGKFGIAVVETKGRSKPENGETKLWASNDKVQFLDGGYDGKPLQQVRANADRIREVLYQIVRDAGNSHFNFKRSEDVPVIPVVCYPGWFVDHRRTDCKDVWLTHEKPLIRKLRDHRQIWDQEQVVRLSHLYGKHLRKDRRNLLFEPEDG